MDRQVPGGTDIADLRRRIAALEGVAAATLRLEPALPRAGRRGRGPRQLEAAPGHPRGIPDGPARTAPEPPGTAISAPPPSPGEVCSLRAAGVLPFGVEALDGRFAGGGLPLGALHELGAAETRDVGALAGFAAALAVRAAEARAGAVVWTVDRTSPGEAGRPHAPALHALGLDPGRIVFVEAADAGDVLWVLEEALTSRGVAVALGEIRGNPRPLDLTATRRLALRARALGGLGLILRTAAAPEPTAAATRFRVASRPAATLGGFAEGVGRPAWRVELTKNRDGRLGGLDLTWDHHERAFRALPPDPVALPAAPADGPPDPRGAGQVLALRRFS
ncbi:hypothetical protein [Prosthecomicrobium sp. N25]|uniref:hypothetical protein n=1 Tax=Prosthecomicrobium sp. N25 TaxID=3129254 RepID=UPI003077120F